MEKCKLSSRQKLGILLENKVVETVQKSVPNIMLFIEFSLERFREFWTKKINFEVRFALFDLSQPCLLLSIDKLQ